MPSICLARVPPSGGSGSGASAPCPWLCSKTILSLRFVESERGACGVRGRHSCLPTAGRADRNVRATLGASNESNESRETSESILPLECQVFALPEYRLQAEVVQGLQPRAHGSVPRPSCPYALSKVKGAACGVRGRQECLPAQMRADRNARATFGGVE
jgi:hypothetical protein